MARLLNTLQNVIQRRHSNDRTMALANEILEAVLQDGGGISEEMRILQNLTLGDEPQQCQPDNLVFSTWEGLLAIKIR